MIVNINEEWRLASDPLQWMVQKSHVVKKGKTKGETIWRSQSWHQHIDGAIIWLARHRIMVAVGTYEGEALQPLSQMFEEIREMVRGIRVEVGADHEDQGSV